ncbi:hypothetical protein MED297_14077 [Reinekea sp. MED297]|uniref:UPF0301 protein MED297_14077 n=2 Tax=Reinekea TaxID=230494 RepID=A4BI12_9GAMM|nr:hypothetical protein MED297_14077 [Reinekea sp. MED297] [Reinekea blandensis MED297]
MNLNHHFLIAMPQMGDPVFSGTLTYLVQHDEQGALGLIVNRPLNLNLEEVFESSELSGYSPRTGSKPVYHGGPVAQEQGFILHPPTEQTWISSLSNEQLVLTTSRDMLEAIAQDEGPERFLFCLGYSGWSPGQLEEELKENAWLTVEANEAIIFQDDEVGKYQHALSDLGIDLATLSGHGGLA